MKRKILVENWHKTWSMRIAMAAGVLMAAEPYLTTLQLALPPGTYQMLLVAMAVARVIKQNDATKPAKD